MLSFFQLRRKALGLNGVVPAIFRDIISGSNADPIDRDQELQWYESALSLTLTEPWLESSYFYSERCPSRKEHVRAGGQLWRGRGENPRENQQNATGGAEQRGGYRSAFAFYNSQRVRSFCRRPRRAGHGLDRVRTKPGGTSESKVIKMVNL